MKYSLVLLAMVAGSLYGQEHKQGMVFTKALGPGPVGVEGMMGGSIKGQPYSADVTMETVQILADGNRIVDRKRSFVARDSQGRTRNEMELKMVGAPNSGDAPVKIIMIHDPINKVTYTLDMATKTARKVSVPDNDMLQAKVAAEAGFAVVPDNVAHAGGTVAITAMRMAPGAQKSESLGSRVIEGVQADGTRATETIAAGQIGNDKDIVITDEVWTAQDLKAVVLSKHMDPRMGEMTYQLSNIQRTEPAASLFEVPSDYTVVEGTPKNVFYYRHKE